MFPMLFADPHDDSHRDPRRRIWRGTGFVLLVGLAFAVVACGATTSGGQGGAATTTPTATSPATPTSAPTATRTAAPTATRTPAPTATATPPPKASWRIVSSPNAAQYQQNELFAVSALSPSDAWAVGGSYNDGLAEHSLLVRWDGAAWRSITTTDDISLLSVAGLTSNDVWVVGFNRIPPVDRRTILFEHWNGTQWSVVPNPNPVKLNNFVLSLAVVDHNDVWAVGQIFNASNVSLPLTERWDGTSWKIVANPTLPDVSESTLRAVARIPGTHQLWTVGYALKGPRPAYEQPLIERWDGTSWQVTPSPALPSGAFGGNLNGVVALSTTDAWAVGDYTASNHTIHSLIAHWDGTAWKVVKSPDTWGTLSNVAAANAHDVRAVGRSFSGDGNEQHGLIEQWNGTSWQVVKSPEPSGVNFSTLTSITTDGAGHYWAAGSDSTPTGSARTLMLYCP